MRVVGRVGEWAGIPGRAGRLGSKGAMVGELFSGITGHTARG